MTCGTTCRQKRSQRLKALNRRRQQIEDYDHPAAGRMPAEIDAAIPDAVAKELAPIVRENLNEDTLRSIQRLINLSPTAIETLATQLDSEDEKISQAAAKTVLQYTVGHPALVKKEEDEGPPALTVNFALPRPATGDAVPDQPEVAATEEAEKELDGEAEEIRQCENCEEDKPESQFVGGSDCCVTCFNARQNEHQALLERTA